MGTSHSGHSEQKKEKCFRRSAILTRNAARVFRTQLPETNIGEGKFSDATLDPLQVAGDKGVDLSDLRARKAADNHEQGKRIGKKWRTAAQIVLTETRNGTSKSDYNNRNHADSNDLTLLQFLALNSLDLTFPASDILLKNQRNEWVQLSGHEGAFAPAGPGTIWKKRTVKDDTEVRAYQSLMSDVMHDLVPHFYKQVEWNNEYYIEIEDLLCGFDEPSVMDIKMGTRTFTEAEVKNQSARADLYQKMVKVDPTAPTEEERQNGAITKLRYMTFREQQSSSSTLGFRIEALKFEGSAPVKDLKLVKTQADVLSTMRLFLADRDACRIQLMERLKEIRGQLEQSKIFNTHEVVGSSILIIHDKKKAGAWMIDFAKTTHVPDGVTIDHRSNWVRGNHEDGYLFGLDNLIRVLEEVGEHPVPESEDSLFTKC